MILRGAVFVFFCWLFLGGIANACRSVGPVDSVAIDATALAQLQKSGISRATLFDAIKQVSQTETSGCWGGATGNFDEQLVSVGAL